MCFTEQEKKELLSRISTLEENVAVFNSFIPTLKREMRDSEFWGMLWAKLKEAQSLLQWILGLIVVVLALTGHMKTILVSWLAIK